MIFASKFNSHTKQSFYINDYCIIKGVNECNYIHGYKIPEGCSSIDKSYKIALIKQYNEQLERTKLGYITFSDGKSSIFNMTDHSVRIVCNKELGYGNTIFGVMDTTGTASGQKSPEILYKAYSELLEKNELGLLWYKKLGYSLKLDSKVKNTLNACGIHDKKIYIFFSRNLSSEIAFTVIIFDEDNRLIATGVSLNHNPESALQSAILEAKLMKFTYYTVNKFSKYKFFDVEPVYDYVNHLYHTMQMISLIDISESKKYMLQEWVKHLYFSSINTQQWQDTITIRIFSEELLNCLPTKDNVLCSKEKEIVRRYSLDGAVGNGNIPDCIVI